MRNNVFILYKMGLFWGSILFPFIIHAQINLPTVFTPVITIPTPNTSTFSNYGQMLSPRQQGATIIDPFMRQNQNTNTQLAQYERDRKEYELLQQQSDHNIKEALALENAEMENRKWLSDTKAYREAFNQLSKVSPDSFSLEDIVFKAENAYFNNKINKQYFDRALNQKVELVRQILKKERLDPHNNISLNYAIMKLFQQSNSFYDKKSKRQTSIKPLGYDFEDFMGEKDYSKVMAFKLLATGKGQCHSLPLVYLMIAEKLGAKAYLSMAPQHSFVQFEDANGNMVNFETTNGHLVSSSWMEQSGFINANALKSKTYMDTLSSRKLYAQCMTDLLLGYTHKFGYDGFAEQMQHQVLKIDPDNLTANLMDAGIKTSVAMNRIAQAGKPPLKELPNYPAAFEAYQAMQASYDRIDNLGYQDMPKEMYQRWLQSMDKEKNLQESKALQVRMQQQAAHLKNIKIKVITTNTGK